MRKILLLSIVLIIVLTNSQQILPAYANDEQSELDKTIEKRPVMWYDNNIRYDGEVGPSNEKVF